MSMTKKDFIRLADHLKFIKLDAEAVGAIDAFCHEQNPRFLSSRFWDYRAGKCGSNGGKIKISKTKEIV